jgi:hypothetical protein
MQHTEWNAPFISLGSHCSTIAVVDYIEVIRKLSAAHLKTNNQNGGVLQNNDDVTIQYCCFERKTHEGDTFRRTCQVSIPLRYQLEYGTDDNTVYCIGCVEHIYRKEEKRTSSHHMDKLKKRTVATLYNDPVEMRIYMLGYIWARHDALLFGPEFDERSMMTVNGLPVTEPTKLVNNMHMRLSLEKIREASNNSTIKITVMKSSRVDRRSVDQGSTDRRSVTTQIYVYNVADLPTIPIATYLKEHSMYSLLMNRLDALCNLTNVWINQSTWGSKYKYQSEKLPLGVGSYQRDLVAIHFLTLICSMDESLTKWYIQAELMALRNNLMQLTRYEDTLNVLTGNKLTLDKQKLSTNYTVEEYLTDVLEERLSDAMSKIHAAREQILDGIYPLYEELIAECINYITAHPESISQFLFEEVSTSETLEPVTLSDRLYE